MKRLHGFDIKKVNVEKKNWPVISCLLTVVLTVFYAFGVWKGLNFTAVNLLCVSLFFSNFGPGIVESINRKKAQLFLTAVFIGTAAEGLNLWIDYQTLDNFDINRLSVWSFVWMLLLFSVFVSLIIIWIRLIRWSQEQWEELQKKRQERRMKRKDLWEKYISDKRQHRLEMQEIRQNHQRGALEKKLKGKEERQQREEKREEGKQEEGKWESKAGRKRRKFTIVINIEGERIKNEGKDGKVGRKRTPSEGEKEKEISIGTVILRSMVVLIIILGYVFLPYIDRGGKHFSKWIDGVGQLIKVFGGTDIAGSDRAAFVYYTLLYVVVVAMVMILINFIIRIITKDGKSTSDGDFNFLETYQEPIAALIVLGAAVYIFTNGELGFSNLNKSWELLVFIISMALVVFTAIEIVRIILVQCARGTSLLRRIIYLVFIAVLKFLSEILLGFISNLRIQELLNSVLFWVFPEQDSLNKQIDRKLKKLFGDEIAKVGNEEQKQPASKKFHRDRVWRRRK